MLRGVQNIDVHADVFVALPRICAARRSASASLRVLSLLALLAVSAAPSELFVIVEGEAGACVHSVKIPASLVRTLPGIAIRLGPPPIEQPAFVVRVTVRDDELVLRLADARGEEVSTRRLANPPDACGANADAVALVVERHLRDLGYVPPAVPERPPPEPAGDGARAASAAPALPAAPTGAAPSAAGPTRTSTPTTALPAAKSGAPPSAAGPTRTSTPTTALALEAALLGFAAAPGAGGFRPGIALEARARWLPFEVGVVIAGSAPGAVDIRRADGRQPGFVRAWALLVGGQAGACALAGRLCAGVGAGTELVRGDVGGDLFQSSPRTRSAAVLWAEARYQTVLVGPLGAALSARLLARPSPAVFEIDGAVNAYEDPAVSALLGAGIFVRLF